MVIRRGDKPPNPGAGHTARVARAYGLYRSGVLERFHQFLDELHAVTPGRGGGDVRLEVPAQHDLARA